MATFTRLQLRTRQQNNVDFASAKDFSLVNNLEGTTYFNIEGARLSNNTYKKVFDSASITTLVNCTVITGSSQAGFIINPDSTATFTFTPGSGHTIKKEEMDFFATNPLLFNTLDPTSSGSAFGVTLDTDA